MSEWPSKSLISDGSADEGAEQMKMLYLSCPPEMQETLLNNTKRLTEELISLLFTRSVNIISVISKIEYIQEASPQIFLCLSSVFLKKVTKKEQGIYFYIPCSVRSILANVLIKWHDARVKRSKSRSCLHDKAFELGTRQTWGRSDLRSKSTDSECLQNCGSSLLRSNSWASVGGKRPFDPNIMTLEDNLVGMPK